MKLLEGEHPEGKASSKDFLGVMFLGDDSILLQPARGMDWVTKI